MPSTLSKLYDAAASGSVERTVAVLSQGSVDIDGGYGDVGRTPLMAASTMGYLRVVRVLLRPGARVSVADNDGATALHLSIVIKHLAVSRALVKAGAGVEARGVDGTPLHVAAAKGFHKGMVMLIHVDAVHAISWCWPSALEKSKPIVRVLPGLKRRATKPCVLLAALSRYNNKQDGPFLGYSPDKNGE
ncbi:EsV-1-1 [Ectocarpus siliculosus]|uniref:EsV-1-1 n=1 Tax=Ectocarpus siliculosus TaxID=2880 RepID=D7G2C8_ECTSI|nr:EsV-1-1 [Ectocarpus siliculosus]|eukprot:CBJ48805.1 EsV-1-1 [Ectocarpus siliculosus]